MASSEKKQNYWRERDYQNALRVNNYSSKQAKMITRWFNRSLGEMDAIIKGFYRQYGDANGLSEKEAHTLLNDRGALGRITDQYEELVARHPDDMVARELLNRLYTAKSISRKEFLQMQLQSLATQLYGQYEAVTLETVTKTFEENYYKSMFDYQQYVGFGHNFNRISTHLILSATSTAWAGKNYSQRIWSDHRTSLARYMNRIVTTGFIQGQSNGMMTAELRKAMDMGAYEARRLVRTEANYVANRGNLLSYQENDTEEFEFLATLDFKTSTICRGMDGKLFLVKEAAVGVNMPPLHPFCRSTTVPHVPDEEFDAYDTRVARDGEGNTYKVPADMNYPQWYETHVAHDFEERLHEIKYKNGQTDAAQWRSYRERLHKNAPSTLDTFQNIKYTDSLAWTKLKQHYRGKGYLLRAGKDRLNAL